MAIRLTDEQWAAIQHCEESPSRMTDPAQCHTFVLVPEGVYERLKPLVENDPVTNQERLFQLQQFGRRAGWDDPRMDVYGDLDPRRRT